MSLHWRPDAADATRDKKLLSSSSSSSSDDGSTAADDAFEPEHEPTDDKLRRPPPPAQRRRSLLASARTAWLAALALLVVWRGYASLRTEFGFLQQATCQFALFHDDRAVVVEPLRLTETLPAAAGGGSLRAATERDDDEACVPRTLDAASVAYPTHHVFYDALRAAQKTSLPPPPVFRGAHATLCNEFRGAYSGWDYCLPITGRKDEPHCSATDRADLLAVRAGETPCFGSALHLLLVDVYEQIKAAGGHPAVLFGTLLGAVRNGTTIPFTEDADVGFVCHRAFSLATLRESLRVQGYHLFLQGVWRVCIAPTHPLAPVLYDATMTTPKKHKVPYVDLYAMNPEDGGGQWRVDKMENDRRIPADKFAPYAQVQLNGMAFDTVADPRDFLVHEYGDGFLTPRPREET